MKPKAADANTTLATVLDAIRGVIRAEVAMRVEMIGNVIIVETSSPLVARKQLGKVLRAIPITELSLSDRRGLLRDLRSLGDIC
jgi:hypothetical protein